MMHHWLAHVLGLDNGGGGWYLFWSGFGANFGELALIGALLGLYHRHNCHIRHCWRIGRRQVEGTPFSVCRRHNPSPKPTHAHVVALHREYLEARARRNTPPPGPGKAGERLYDHERDGL